MPTNEEVEQARERLRREEQEEAERLKNHPAAQQLGEWRRQRDEEARREEEQREQERERARQERQEAQEAAMKAELRQSYLLEGAPRKGSKKRGPACATKSLRGAL